MKFKLKSFKELTTILNKAFEEDGIVFFEDLNCIRSEDRIHIRIERRNDLLGYELFVENYIKGGQVSLMLFGENEYLEHRELIRAIRKLLEASKYYERDLFKI